MEFYQPQVLLEKITHMNRADEYFLHAVTYCKCSNYINAGFDPVLPELNDIGLWQINLNIAIDVSIEEENLNTPSPIVHYLELGHLPIPDDDVFIQVNLFEIERTDKKPKGSVTVSSASANEKEREVHVC